MFDPHVTEKKWQQKWADAALFEAVPDNRKKFFCNFPYPYINAYQHIGHLFTLMRVEACARYKRLQGFNVLFPQGWHATGSPIIQAAKRVKNREPKQLKIMHDMGFTDDQLSKFEDPAYWIEFFAPEFKNDYNSIGMSIDWRREFHTTSLNPRYDKFIRWQFDKLKQKNYIIKGKFPVVWDPVENVPVGDHDRIEGEGEVPQEFMLVKHKLNDGRFLVSATLRPDTILGITNLYVHPDIMYKEIEINKEIWIVSTHAAQKFEEQGKKLKIKKEVKGITFLGQETEELDGHRVPILPATFLDEHFGTGLVHSVPSDSADDLIALHDLQKNDELLDSYNLDKEKIRAIAPLPVLDTPGYGDIPAQKFLDKYKVTSQNDRGKLEKIKKELYKINFYTATYNSKYKKFFSKNLHGRKIEDGKELIQKEVIERGWGDTYYQLTGKVVARSLAECIVKIVDDQWFINYGNEQWKQDAHACLDAMKLFPEKARSQFAYVIDWLRAWACTRESGLGTSLPWDEKWLIESLSDSTIYMAFYTIAHILNQVPEEHIDHNLFDFVFLGKKVAIKCDKDSADAMRTEFNYWYPVDFRNSGKDLIQNHLTFFIFNHVAIFPKKHWPQGIGTNGWVTVDGQKMSKSLGNMIPVRDVVKQYGADATRLTILSGGEGFDDPNWDSSLAAGLGSKFSQTVELVVQWYGNGVEDRRQIDTWMESKVHRTITDATAAMEVTLFRSAIQSIFFDLGKHIRSYIQKTHEQPNKQVLQHALESFCIMTAPFTPHLSEELWERMGKKPFVATAPWPHADETKINRAIEAVFEELDQTKRDIRSVMKLAKIHKPKKITLFVAAAWKFGFYETLKEKIAETRDVAAIMKFFSNSPFKTHLKLFQKQLPKLVQQPARLPEFIQEPDAEFESMQHAAESLSKEFNCEVVVVQEEDSKAAKASQAAPGKVAIQIE